MSDQSQGPGWWQASDGVYYPPESHPDEAYRAQFADTPGSPPVAYGETSTPVGDAGKLTTYPARLIVNPDQSIARWRVFAHGFMLIPHFIISYVISAVANVCIFISWFAILFTGRMPEGLHNIIAMSLRYSHRIMGFGLFMTEQYPPFEFAAQAKDPGDYPPIRADFDYEGDDRNRLTTFFRFFMVIPHMIVLAFIMIAAYVIVIILWWAVLITGRVPDGITNFLVGLGRWVNRLSAYSSLLTDEYPPFSFD